VKQIRVRYSYRLEHIEDVYDAIDKLVPSVRRARREAILAGCLLLIAPFLAARSFLHPELFLVMMEPFAFGLLWWGVWSPKRDVRQRYSQAVDIWPEVDVFIDSSGILTHTRAVPGELVIWEDISQAVEGRTAVGLVLRDTIVIVPESAFSIEEWDKFRKLVSERVQFTVTTTRKIH